jgi:peptide/nickel transport system ATP-binding protein
MPSLDTHAKRLVEIPGLVPDPRVASVGCAFAPRCALADERCRVEMPPLHALAGDHVVACFAAQEGRR